MYLFNILSSVYDISCWWQVRKELVDSAGDCAEAEAKRNKPKRVTTMMFLIWSRTIFYKIVMIV